MFIMYGPGITNPVPLEKLFKQRKVAKTSATAQSKVIKEDAGEHDGNAVLHQPNLVQRKYRQNEGTKQIQPTLKAAQIMTTPVIAILAKTSVHEALDILESNQFRHLPVVSSEQALIGIVSEHDIYRCVCGTGLACMHCSTDNKDILIESVMEKQVLTASVDTDARYIARLFVEQGIGSVPIVEDNQLVGMVTHSDILRAVMLHFNLDVWE